MRERVGIAHFRNTALAQFFKFCDVWIAAHRFMGRHGLTDGGGVIAYEETYAKRKHR